jgi:hypothetical protein
VYEDIIAGIGGQTVDNVLFVIPDNYTIFNLSKYDSYGRISTNRLYQDNRTIIQSQCLLAPDMVTVTTSNLSNGASLQTSVDRDTHEITIVPGLRLEFSVFDANNQKNAVFKKIYGKGTNFTNASYERTDEAVYFQLCKDSMFRPVIMSTQSKIFAMLELDTNKGYGFKLKIADSYLVWLTDIVHALSLV